MRRFLSIAPFIVLTAALALLYTELRHLKWEDFLASFHSYTYSQLAAALFFLAVNFFVWTLYGYSSLRQLGWKLPYSEVFKTCAIAFPFTNLIGYSMITGFAVRAKKYAGHGLTMSKITQLMLFNIEAWWVGFLTVTGTALLVVPESGRLFGLSTNAVMWTGALLNVLVLVYIGACAIADGRRLRFQKFSINLPDLNGALLKLSAGATDGLAIALTFYVLLPSGHSFSFLQFASFYLVGQLLAIVSFVPGGLGVLESSLLFLLRPYLSDAEILSSLVLFRIVHYLIPAAMAGAFLLYIEAVGGSKSGNRRKTSRPLVSRSET